MRIKLKLIPASANRWIAGLVMISVSQISFAHGREDRGASHEQPAATLSGLTGPRAVAEAFNHALAMGDGDAARGLLLPDVLIFESGGAETSAAEYSGHHLAADIAFLSNLKREQLSQHSGGDETYAWVATRSRLSGRFHGKDVDLDSTETLVLVKMDAGWRISHIHWSSAARARPKP